VRQLSHFHDVDHVRRRGGDGVHHTRIRIYADMRIHTGDGMEAGVEVTQKYLPEYYCWAVQVWCISGSRALALFLVEHGAWMIIASTIAPWRNNKPLSVRYALTVASR
jgi:hypothetical protein